MRPTESGVAGRDVGVLAETQVRPRVHGSAFAIFGRFATARRHGSVSKVPHWGAEPDNTIGPEPHPSFIEVLGGAAVGDSHGKVARAGKNGPALVTGDGQRA
jgi:hypothetical protein